MTTINFMFDSGKNVKIQSNKNEKMEDIISRLSIKTDSDLSSSTFLYSGGLLKRNLTLDNISNKTDKERKRMEILVMSQNDMNDDNDIKESIKSKEIICNVCKELCKINIYDYKISLYDCKNNHKTPNIHFEDFDKTQKKDENKIICNRCNNNKKKAYNNLFYICKSCKINICPLCKEKHDITHNIINYDESNYLCDYHNRQFNYYCNSCKKDLCMLCVREHKFHNIISYGEMILNMADLKNKLMELRNNIDKIKKNINGFNNGNDIVQNMVSYYKISEFIIQNFDDKKLNFCILKNIYQFHKINEEYTNELNKINNESDVNNKSEMISAIYNKIQAKDNNENDKIYPEDQTFIDYIYGDRDTYSHQSFFFHGPHHGPYDWDGFHGPHNWDGPHGPHGPHDWDGFHGPHNWDGPHGPHGPHDWHGPHGPHGWDGPHGPHDWHGPHGPHGWDGPHGPHGWDGPHGPHGWDGPHGPHDWHGPHGPHDWHGPHGPHDWHGHHHGPHDWHGHHGPNDLNKSTGPKK